MGAGLTEKLGVLLPQALNTFPCFLTPYRLSKKRGRSDMKCRIDVSDDELSPFKVVGIHIPTDGLFFFCKFFSFGSTRHHTFVLFSTLFADGRATWSLSMTLHEGWDQKKMEKLKCERKSF
jgi:hypothetical protein